MEATRGVGGGERELSARKNTARPLKAGVGVGAHGRTSQRLILNDKFGELRFFVGHGDALESTAIPQRMQYQSLWSRPAQRRPRAQAGGDESESAQRATPHMVTQLAGLALRSARTCPPAGSANTHSTALCIQGVLAVVAVAAKPSREGSGRGFGGHGGCGLRGFSGIIRVQRDNDRQKDRDRHTEG